MEFCGGGDLGSFIRKHGSLPEAVTRKFFRQLACGLQYMRAMNVAHMDLKPQNILLSNKYRPSIKVLNFIASINNFLNVFLIPNASLAVDFRFWSFSMLEKK